MSISGSAAAGSPNRNARIAGANLAAIKNFDGVFRVTARPEALQSPRMMFGASKGSFHRQKCSGDKRQFLFDQVELRSWDEKDLLSSFTFAEFVDGQLVIRSR